MDILYYSNYCKHSQKVVQFLAKNQLIDQLNFICIDKRKRDPKTNQMLVQLENGKIVILPPNVHSVPTLLLVKQNYQTVLGDDIIQRFQPNVQTQQNQATRGNGEPVAFPLNAFSTGNSNIVSEQYTYYNMTPDELSAKGKGGMRQMHNYMPAAENIITIPTPPDTYRPDKVSSSVTIDQLQQQRMEEIGQNPNAAFYQP